MAAPGPGSRAKSAVASSPLFPPGGRSSPPSPLRAGVSHEMASEALTGATQASAAASTALRDASTAADAVKAMGSVRRPIVRLMRRYHRCLSAALADVRGTRRLLRRARRVAIAETRAPQRHWVERMVTACGTVARCVQRSAVLGPASMFSVMVGRGAVCDRMVPDAGFSGLISAVPVAVTFCGYLKMWVVAVASCAHARWHRVKCL